MRSPSTNEKVQYLSIDGSVINSPVAYCKAKKAYLSVRQYKLHKCGEKKGKSAYPQCPNLLKLACTYWESRGTRKDRKRKSRERMADIDKRLREKARRSHHGFGRRYAKPSHET